MALTDDQKASVRYYLGWPDVNRMADLRLEGAMGSVSTQAVTQIAALLASLATLDAALLGTSAISAAGLKSVDNGGVEWFSATSAQASVNAQGRRLVARLAAILQISIKVDVFGSSVASSGMCGVG